MIGVVTPSEDVLAKQQCDIEETLWTGESSTQVVISNWGLELQTIEEGQIVGEVQPGTVVDEDDPVWNDTSVDEVLCVQHIQESTSDESGRRLQLQEQLQIGSQNTDGERKQLEELLLGMSDVFALQDSELGETDLVTHTIDTGSAKPVQTSPRQLPYVLRHELEQDLRSLLHTGCIEPSSSPYASALVLVRKKNGALCVCVDYRGVNKNTVPDQYPLPRIDELIDMIGKNKPRIFTSLDLMRGYHQVRMAKDSKPKTAFTCHMGLFQYRWMLFGLTNASATFQQLMSHLFSGEKWSFVSVYLDDLLIVSKTMEEHVSHVCEVLVRLKEAGLRLKPSKCMFATAEIEYLGHTLTPEGV